jgi:hypothetical protein
MQYERYGATSNTASYGGVAKDVTVVVCKSIAGACEASCCGDTIPSDFHFNPLPHPNPKAIIIVDTQ